MSTAWQLQEAKNRLSAVVDRAMSGETQVITRRGKEVVVVLSMDAYRKLKPPSSRLSDFLRASPVAGVELDLTRSKDPGRDVEL
jgi:antitoxin Phd